MRNTESSNHESPTCQDFALELDGLLRALPETVTVSDEACTIAVGALESIDERYGSAATERMLPYHNAYHSLDVVRRGFHILEQLDGAIPGMVTPSDYELMLIAGCYHDIEQSSKSDGRNELLSAAKAVGAMRSTGHCLTTEMRRVREAIVATTVNRDEAGTITQQHLRHGTKDPLKFALAMADINGIAMEGMDRMLGDATNLYMEINGYSTMQDPRGFAQFLATQGKFITQRLDAVDQDVAYYFDEQHREAALRVIKKEFEPGARALRLAGMLEDPLKFGTVERCLSEIITKSQSGIDVARQAGHELLRRLTGSAQG